MLKCEPRLINTPKCKLNPYLDVAFKANRIEQQNINIQIGILWLDSFIVCIVLINDYWMQEANVITVVCSHSPSSSSHSRSSDVASVLLVKSQLLSVFGVTTFVSELSP